MSKTIVLVFMALALTITYVSACFCRRPSVKQNFCNDDFARLFKIGANTTKGSDRVYEVEMLKTYRTIPYTDLDEDKLYTSDSNAWCGVRLIKDAYYVISGFYVNKSGNTHMRTSTCALQLYLPNDPNGQVPKYTPPKCNTTEPVSGSE